MHGAVPSLRLMSACIGSKSIFKALKNIQLKIGDGATAWNSLSYVTGGGGGGGGTWGSITGTLSAQTDLQTALNDKVATSSLNELVDDRVAALLVAGTNITLSYNDPAGTITVSASGGGGSGNTYFPSGW